MIKTIAINGSTTNASTLIKGRKDAIKAAVKNFFSKIRQTQDIKIQPKKISVSPVFITAKQIGEKHINIGSIHANSSSSFFAIRQQKKEVATAQII